MRFAHHSATRLQALCHANSMGRRNASRFLQPTSIRADRTLGRSIRPMLAVHPRCPWKWILLYGSYGETRAMTTSDRREGLDKSVWRETAELDRGKVEHARKEREDKSKPPQLTVINRKRSKLLVVALVAFFIYAEWFLWDEVYFYRPFNTPPQFSDFELEKREQLSSTSMIITTPPIRNRIGRALNSKGWGRLVTDYYEEQWYFGTWSVEIKQPQLQISREYTPLPQDSENPEKLRFLIRKEKGGEMSNYLWGLNEKEKLELRGPKPGFELKKGITDVVFLAGGTGIAPALQVAYTLLERKNYEMNQSPPKITILWANRRREELQSPDQIAAQHQVVTDDNDTDIPTTSKIPHKTQNPIVKIITDLQRKHPGCLEVMYLVDEEGSMIHQKLISSAMKGDEKKTEEGTSADIDSKLLFVSGPEGFVNHFAGPKKWQGGVEQQGLVGGVLGNMGITGWKVWKF